MMLKTNLQLIDNLLASSHCAVCANRHTTHNRILQPSSAFFIWLAREKWLGYHTINTTAFFADSTASMLDNYATTLYTCRLLKHKRKANVMGMLLLPSEALASELESDLEGRLEVMADDGLRDSPDYQDASAVAEAIRGTYSKPYPTTLELSDAETQQAYITLENMLELAEGGSREENAGLLVLRHLEEQGYPWGGKTISVEEQNALAASGSIFDYFSARLGIAPADVSFRDLPVDSNCGADCKRAIDAAAELIAADSNAGGGNRDVIREIVFHACQVYWRG